MSNKKYLFVALSGAIASMFVGCQSDAIELAGDEGANEYTYNISADANQVSTRALSLGGNGKEINSTWLEGEEIIAYVLSDENKSKRTEYGLLSSMGEGKTTKFQGTIVSNKKQLSTSDDICFLYPGAASKGANKTISPVIAKEGGVRHEPSKTIAQRVELNLTRQDGKVETIGKRFDYQWAKAKPTKVQGQNVKVTIGVVKRVVSIWGLRFADSNNQILTNIDSVYISNVKSTDVFDLGTGNLVDNNASDENINIAIVPNAGEKLSSAGGKYTYLAALPGNYTDVYISVFVGDKCYVRQYASINLEADNTYFTDVLQLQEAKQQPYVEVQGVKWATGNFIHYGDPNGGYWGIAPAQWWISRRAVSLNAQRKEVKTGGTLQSSQFENSPKQTTNDVDLFQFGHIKEALNFKNSNYFVGDLSKYWQFYKKMGIHDRPTTNRSEAERGDIVWYHTMLNHQKYRIPRKDEINELYTKANVIPGYCYTDKGTIVYGAFFTTNTGGNRILKYPSKRSVKSISNYTNVTALVKANKGLFLPYTGRRMPGQDIIGYRDVSNNQNGYGQYMTSSSYQKGSWDLFFGLAEWNLAINDKTQARAIRPVWVSGDDQSDTTHPDFRNIH